MESVFRYVAPASQCGYLPDQVWRLQYDIVAELSAAEYAERLLHGWRRFGNALFRPRCPACSACQSVRVLAEQFHPNRSQRRVRIANEGVVRLRLGWPKVTDAKLDLYDRFHAYQMEAKGWPDHGTRDAPSYFQSFVDNPFPTQEWCYYLKDKLVGVGYVDDVPGALSAIYFFYDPDERDRSLGTWNVLSVLEQARQRHIAHVYLGYFVPGCSSMAYKVQFAPNQLLGTDGHWRDFRG